MNLLIEPIKENKQVLVRTMKLLSSFFKDPIKSAKLDQAVNEVIKSKSKEVPYELINKDNEKLTGICKCGRVTAKADGEFHCKYCGQRLYW